MRGATRNDFMAQTAKMRVSTHAPHAGSDDDSWFWRGCDYDVSTHAPHAGSDAAHCARSGRLRGFNPRSPCGERPDKAGLYCPCRAVSTHAPHAGSDVGVFCSVLVNVGFQPTLPMRGATPYDLGEVHVGQSFNPRSPSGERL